MQKSAPMVGIPTLPRRRDSDDIMPPTLCANVVGIDYTVFDRELQQDIVDQAVSDGFFSQPDRHVPGLFRNGLNSATLNAGHLFDLDALNSKQLSNGYAQGRKFVEEYIEFYRKYMPGCEHIRAISTGSSMGVRESRRVVGEYSPRSR